MDINELKMDELNQVAGGAGKDGPGGSPSPLPPKDGCFVYRIQHGDKLGIIARTFNTTTARIKAVNPGLIINENFIRAGYYIYIPA